jgi:hypothetical protein
VSGWPQTQACTIAQRGQYSPGGPKSQQTTRCYTCPQGMTTSLLGGPGASEGSDGTGRVAAQDCAYCLPGWCANTGSTNLGCRLAAVGQWAPGGPLSDITTRCNQCPEGTTTYWEQSTVTDGTGRDDLSDCSVCLPGWGTTDTAPQTCSRAEKGQYAPGGPIGNFDTRIRNCPEGSTTTLDLSASAGTHNNDIGDCACKCLFISRLIMPSLHKDQQHQGKQIIRSIDEAFQFSPQRYKSTKYMV